MIFGTFTQNVQMLAEQQRYTITNVNVRGVNTLEFHLVYNPMPCPFWVVQIQWLGELEPHVTLTIVDIKNRHKYTRYDFKRYLAAQRGVVDLVSTIAEAWCALVPLLLISGE